MSRPLFVKTLNGWVEGESVWQKTKNGWVKGEAMAVKTNNGWQSAIQEHVHEFEYAIYSKNSTYHQRGSFCKNYLSCGGINWISSTEEHNKQYSQVDNTQHFVTCISKEGTHTCNYNAYENHNVKGYVDNGDQATHECFCPCGYSFGSTGHVFYSPQKYVQYELNGIYAHYLVCSDCGGYDTIQSIPMRCVDTDQDGFCNTCGFSCNYQQ